ncbi:MAG: efflux RND transporter periplasmic adaptor subunit [Candidatus Taylorbacteria bacterium]|nr:efflux RND transporter periplasmic adaptor subunit [Candidatus Taylorbacteria bacterium]
MENPKSKQSLFAKPWLQSLIGIFIIAIALGGLLYWRSISSYIAIDMSEVSAPLINIGPESEGILSETNVKLGDKVVTNESVARVGSEILSTKTSGIITSVQNTPGQVFMPGSPVVSMIDPNQLRIVGKIDEDKGLSRIQIGDPTTFTVDAFGSAQFMGIVDEISPTSDQSGILFSISDKREIKQFDIKVRYDTSLYPQFKNGMSAKLRIYAK